MFFFKFVDEQNDPMQECSQVCSYNHYFLIKNNGTFQTKSDQNNTSKRNKLH